MLDEQNRKALVVCFVFFLMGGLYVQTETIEHSVDYDHNETMVIESMEMKEGFYDVPFYSNELIITLNEGVAGNIYILNKENDDVLDQRRTFEGKKRYGFSSLDLDSFENQTEYRYWVQNFKNYTLDNNKFTITKKENRVYRYVSIGSKYIAFLIALALFVNYIENNSEGE